ncbi:hypothetical protein FKM82_024130 [Ascaphus truei]
MAACPDSAGAWHSVRTLLGPGRVSGACGGLVEFPASVRAWHSVQAPWGLAECPGSAGARQSVQALRGRGRLSGLHRHGRLS